MKRYIKSTVIQPLEEESIQDQASIVRTTDDVNLIMQAIDNNSNWEVIVAALCNPNAPIEVVDKFLSNQYYAQRLAFDPTVSSEVLRRIYHKAVPTTILELLAQNDNTPSDILDDLFENYPKFRGYIAMNPNISQGLLNQLVHHDSASIRSSVALNSAISEEDLIKLSTDSNEEVRAAVASNHNTPIEILNHLLLDEYNGPRFCARVTLRDLGEL